MRNIDTVEAETCLSIFLRRIAGPRNPHGSDVLTYVKGAIAGVAQGGGVQNALSC